MDNQLELALILTVMSTAIITLIIKYLIERKRRRLVFDKKKGAVKVINKKTRLSKMEIVIVLVIVAVICLYFWYFVFLPSLSFQFQSDVLLFRSLL
jgi:ABC-type Fe3+ transport system permease subunit